MSPAWTVTVALWLPRKAGSNAASTVVVDGGSEVAGGASILGAKPPAAPTGEGEGEREGVSVKHVSNINSHNTRCTKQGDDIKVLPPRRSHSPRCYQRNDRHART